MAQAYLIDDAQLGRLVAIERQLHGNGTHLTPDGRRDLANSLSQLRSEVQEQPWGDVPGASNAQA